MVYKICYNTQKKGKPSSPLQNPRQDICVVLLVGRDDTPYPVKLGISVFYKDIKNILHRQHPPQFILFLIFSIRTLTHRLIIRS
jgi:hypothetical protein